MTIYNQVKTYKEIMEQKVDVNNFFMNLVEYDDKINIALLLKEKSIITDKTKEGYTISVLLNEENKIVISINNGKSNNDKEEYAEVILSLRDFAVESITYYKEDIDLISILKEQFLPKSKDLSDLEYVENKLNNFYTVVKEERFISVRTRVKVMDRYYSFRISKYCENEYIVKVYKSKEYGEILPIPNLDKSDVSIQSFNTLDQVLNYIKRITK